MSDNNTTAQTTKLLPDTKHKRGRPRGTGRSIKITFRLNTATHSAIIERLDRLPPRRHSDYIRRILAGAPIEALDTALAETEALSNALDAMWEDWNA